MITLDNMSRHTRLPEDDLLKWSVYRFFNKYIMLSYKADIEEKHNEILMSRK